MTALKRGFREGNRLAIRERIVMCSSLHHQCEIPPETWPKILVFFSGPIDGRPSRAGDVRLGCRLVEGWRRCGTLSQTRREWERRGLRKLAVTVARRHGDHRSHSSR